MNKTINPDAREVEYHDFREEAKKIMYRRCTADKFLHDAPTIIMEYEDLVCELEKKLEIESDSIKIQDEMIKNQKERLCEAEEVIKFYADEKLYFPRSIIAVCNEADIPTAPIYSEFGTKAKQYLKVDL